MLPPCIFDVVSNGHFDHAAVGYITTVSRGRYLVNGATWPFSRSCE